MGCGEGRYWSILCLAAPTMCSVWSTSIHREPTVRSGLWELQGRPSQCQGRWHHTLCFAGGRTEAQVGKGADCPGEVGNRPSEAALSGPPLSSHSCVPSRASPSFAPLCSALIEGGASVQPRCVPGRFKFVATCPFLLPQPCATPGLLQHCG